MVLTLPTTSHIFFLENSLSAQAGVSFHKELRVSPSLFFFVTFGRHPFPLRVTAKQSLYHPPNSVMLFSGKTPGPDEPGSKAAWQ